MTKYLTIHNGSSNSSTRGRGPGTRVRGSGTRAPRSEFPGGTLAGTMGRLRSVRRGGVSGTLAAARRRGLITPDTARAMRNGMRAR